MGDYVSREGLIKVLTDRDIKEQENFLLKPNKQEYYSGVIAGLTMAMKLVENAEPVVAYYENFVRINAGRSLGTCSCCGWNDFTGAYCLNCGAKMKVKDPSENG